MRHQHSLHRAPLVAALLATAAAGLAGEEAIAEEDFLRDGREVPVICQAHGERAYGSRLWDMVSRDGDTYFVPDRFIRTGTDGRAPEIRRCTRRDLRKVTVPPDPHPPTHP